MMNEDETPRENKPEAATASTDTTAANAEPRTADAADTRDAELKAGRAALDALVADNAELKDRVLRTVAEMENLRKRTEREIGDTRTYAITSFARDMLAATDALSRALSTVPADVRANAEGTTKSLIEGIELTEREMQRLLGKHGVTPIAALGQKFDPHKHQAMFEVPDPSQPEGTVVQVVQEGYAIGDRILRPAMVGVAKGGAKAGVSDATAGIDKSV
ncbi:MAG: nucleotide exchange factor GrpE [Devosia sp.]|nr:nucleotide exchange factor GrpE [Devosia sp.]